MMSSESVDAGPSPAGGTMTRKFCPRLPLPKELPHCLVEDGETLDAQVRTPPSSGAGGALALRRCLITMLRATRIKRNPATNKAIPR